MNRSTGSLRSLPAHSCVRGVAAQIGFNFQPADAKNWGVFADVRYAQLSPEVTLIDAFDNAKFDLDIDPVIYTLGYSYKF